MPGDKTARLSLTLIFGVGLALVPAVGNAFVPEAPFLSGTTQHLGFQPSVVSANDEKVVVAGGSDATDSHIAVLDPSTLQVLGEVQPMMLVEDVVVTPNSDKIIAVGSTGISTEIVVYSDALQQLSRLKLDRLIGYPQLTVNYDGVVSLTGQRTSVAQPALSFYRLDYSGGLEQQKEFRVENSGARGAWVDTKAKLALVNNASRPSVSAFNIVTGRTLATLQVRSDQLRNLTAYSVLGLVGSECGGSAPASLLISDGSARVSLVDFDPVFETLSVKAVAIVKLRLLPGTKLETFKDTLSIKPSTLFASVCDQSVIWISSSYSNEIVQFSRNPRTSDLEKVGSLNIPGLPAAIALPPKGQYGYAAVKGLKSVVSFRRSLSDDDGKAIVGDEKVREIQRLLSEKGYLYGSIDGLVGPSTLRALEVISTQFTVELDIQSDPAATFETLVTTLRE